MLDGPIDPEWVESFNTLLDDNKMLFQGHTKIPLPAHVRIIFETEHFLTATPACVSRLGVVTFQS